MVRYLYALAVVMGSIIVTGCGGGGSNNASSAPSCTAGQVLYSANNTCVQACGDQVTQGIVNGSCTTVNSNGNGAYGSCQPCITPNGISGVILNFYGRPTCGLPAYNGGGGGIYGGGQGMGTIDGQLFYCMNGASGLNGGIGGFNGGFTNTNIYPGPGYIGGGGFQGQGGYYYPIYRQGGGGGFDRDHDHDRQRRF